MAVSISINGDFSKTKKYLERQENTLKLNDLDRYGQAGVDALSSATPIDSGETAASWGYRIKRKKDSITIEWTNSNVIDGVPIAVIIQYGHGTRNGGYVQGRDYINPAIRPLFEYIANNVWKEVNRL